MFLDQPLQIHVDVFGDVRLLSEEVDQALVDRELVDPHHHHLRMEGALVGKNESYALLGGLGHDRSSGFQVLEKEGTERTQRPRAARKPGIERRKIRVTRIAETTHHWHQAWITAASR